MRNDICVPRISKHYLLLVAAVVWTFAGCMLLSRGFIMESSDYLVVKIFSSLVAGLLFFRLLFNRISRKHVLRIKNMTNDRPCMFSFFNLKSYLMMAVMISTGIVLRKTAVIPLAYLSLVYITMGIPLLMSSFRFYHSFFSDR